MKERIIYLRISDSRPSYEEQLEHFKSCEGRVLCDNSNTEKRNNLVDILKMIQNEKVVDLCIYDLSSLDLVFRSFESMAEFYALLESTGTKLKIFQTSDTASSLTIGDALSLYKDVIKKIHAERLRDSFRKRRADGLSVGRPSHRKNNEVNDLRSKGLTLRQIAQQLGISLGSVQRSLRPS